jgi:hypothetical protein
MILMKFGFDSYPISGEKRIRKDKLKAVFLARENILKYVEVI